MKFFGRFLDPGAEGSAVHSRSQMRFERKRFLLFLGELLSRDDVELPSDFTLRIYLENDGTSARLVAEVPEAKHLDRFGKPYESQE